MQKIVTLLLVVLCHVTSFAQDTYEENVFFRSRDTDENSILRPRVTNADFEKAVISANKHLTFKEIPINGSIDNFVKKLQAQGFQMYKQTEGDNSVSGTIQIDSIREIYVNVQYDQTNKNVFGVSSSLTIPCGEDYKSALMEINSKLDGRYFFHVEDNNMFEEESGLRFSECKKYVLDDSKQYYLGSVTVTLYSSQTGFKTITVEYKDAYNIRQQNKLIDGIFDLSNKKEKDYIESCKMGVSDNKLVFYVTEKGHDVSFPVAG